MGNLPLAKKSLGQHWLTDVTTLELICRQADVGPADTVLEIGPGPGTLTKLLAERAGRVVAVELDKQLARALPDRLPASNLEVVQADILSFDLTTLPPGYKVVANIPYYLTSHLIRVLSESANPPALCTLLVQKEVAERLAAAPGNLSILGVTAQYYWRPMLGPLVPASRFTPPPKVDSRIITLSPAPLLAEITTKQFFMVVKAGFSQKRKTLLNSLSAALRMDKAAVQTWCMRAGIDPGRRAQTLSLEEWRRLASKL